MNDTEQIEWRRWMRDFGQQLRRVREFLGLSQDALARRAGVSQGAVSRLETARGLATPLVIVLKVTAVVASELGKLDSALFDAELSRSLEMLTALSLPLPGAGEGRPVTSDPNIEHIVQLYPETPERRRPAVVSILSAAVAALRVVIVVAAAGAFAG